MDKIYIDSDNLVHFARLSLSDNKADVVGFIRKLSRKIAKFDPSVSERLLALTENPKPSRNSILRNERIEKVPVDLDSRLSLARIEWDISVDIEPIWQEPVGSRLTQIVAERIKCDELIAANLSPTRTLLFTGVPGVGKSLAAKWLAKSLNLPLLTIDLAAVMSSFLGRTGNNIRNILDYAKSIDCVLFLDELDALAKRRDDATEVGELKRLVTVLLQEIDTWPSSGLMVAATNHPDLLDPAIWRRFDMIVEFPLPDSESIKLSIENLLDELDETTGALATALSVSFIGTSFSDIHRSITQVKRKAVISGIPVEKSLADLVNERIDKLSKAEKITIAQALQKAGLSQRATQSLTGLSRDTIRKHTERSQTD